jgi:hypothetical protein
MTCEKIRFAWKIGLAAEPKSHLNGMYFERWKKMQG